MQGVTLEKLHREIEGIKKDMKFLKHILISEEKIPKKELKEIKSILREMESGKETKLEDVFS